MLAANQPYNPNMEPPKNGNGWLVFVIGVLLGLLFLKGMHII